MIKYFWFTKNNNLKNIYYLFFIQNNSDIFGQPNWITNLVIQNNKENHTVLWVNIENFFCKTLSKII